MDLAAYAFPLRLSFQVAACATALTAVVGVSLAYVLARKEFRGKEVLDALVTMPMVLPPVVTGYYLLLVIGRTGVLGRLTRGLFGAPVQITFTWYAAVLASFLVSMPLTVKAARAAIESVDPALLSASYVLGHGELATAWRVVLPMARRGIVAGLLLSFARALGEFGATVMVAGNIPGQTNTMPLELYKLVINGSWQAAATLVVLFTVVSASVLYGANRLTRAVAA
jgi:molybdate transport system permease protein